MLETLRKLVRNYDAKAFWPLEAFRKLVRNRYAKVFWPLKTLACSKLLCKAYLAIFESVFKTVMRKPIGRIRTFFNNKLLKINWQTLNKGLYLPYGINSRYELGKLSENVRGKNFYLESITI